jgi:hypothetical protein
MKFHNEYLTFHTKKHRAYVHITPQIETIRQKSGVKEGLVLVSAMHITPGFTLIPAAAHHRNCRSEELQHLHLASRIGPVLADIFRVPCDVIPKRLDPEFAFALPSPPTGYDRSSTDCQQTRISLGSAYSGVTNIRVWLVKTCLFCLEGIERSS